MDEENGSDLYSVMESARKTLSKIRASQVLSPISNHEKVSHDGSSLHSGTGQVSNKEVVSVLRSLIKSNETAYQQIQALEYRNMMLRNTEADIKSRLEVEDSIRKQQFERIRYQLLMDNHNLENTVRQKDLKLAKYKEKIMMKNKRINKLTRLLNGNNIDSSKNSFQESSNNDTYDSGSISNHEGDSTIIYNDSTVLKESATRVEPLDQQINSNAAPYSMLKTLGMLATKVLSDSSKTGASRAYYSEGRSEIREELAHTDEDEETGNMTEIQESKIIEDSSKFNQLRKTETPDGSVVTFIPSIRRESTTKLEGGQIWPASDDLNITNIKMPKMQSFNTHH